jgi:hypothetical protein
MKKISHKTKELLRNKDAIFRIIKSDYSNSINYYREKNSLIRKWRRVYDDIEGDNSKSDVSTYRSRMFKKKVREMVPNISEPILTSQRLYDVDIVAQDGYSADETEISDMLNYQFKSIPELNRIINSLAKSFVIDGTAILKTTWDREEKTIVTGTKKINIYPESKDDVDDFLNKIDKDKKSKLLKLGYDVLKKKLPIGEKEVNIEVKKVVKNRPMIREVDSIRIMTDPNAKGIFSNSRFIIEFVETNYASLRSSGNYFSLDKVKKEIDDNDSPIFDPVLFSELYLGGSSTYLSEDEYAIMFDFDDKARKRLNIVEYWGEVPIDGSTGELVPIVASWIGDTLIRLEENPMPHKTMPYSIQSYEPVKNRIFGESDAEIVAEDQIGSTLAMRNMQDITQRNHRNLTQEFIENGFLPDITQKNNYKNGKTVFYRKGSDPRQAIYRRTIDEIPQVVFQLKDLYDNEIEKSIGTVSAIDTEKADIRDGVDNRMHSIIERFSDIFVDCGSKILHMNTKFSLDSDFYKVNRKIRKVNTSILKSIDSFAVEVTTSAKNAKQIRDLIGLMNTRSANMSEEVAAIHYSKIALLSGMKDLSNEVLDMTINREPSEFEKQQQQLEMMKIQLDLEKTKLEIKRIDTEAMLNIAKAEEAKIKSIEKQEAIDTGIIESQASLNRARAYEYLSSAEKLEAQTGLFNQQFDLEQSGEKRRREELDKEFAHEANLERENIRTERELTMLERKKDANHDGVVTKQESDDFLLNYIKDGTLNNDSYDAVGDVYRNILEKGFYDEPIAQNDDKNTQE